MTWLKFYEKERYNFPTAFNLHYCDEQARIIAKKLLRHALPVGSKGSYLRHYFHVRFLGSNGASACISDVSIRLPHKPSLGEICHEVAHIVHYGKYDDSRHNKRLMRTIAKLIAYSKKKGYWLNSMPQQKLLEAGKTQ